MIDGFFLFWRWCYFWAVLMFISNLDVKEEDFEGEPVLKLKSMNEQKVSKTDLKKGVPLKKCKCGYQWAPRIKKPKCCPKCKQYLGG